MKTSYAEQLEIIKAASEGKEIEFWCVNRSQWIRVLLLNRYDFDNLRYRIKPPETLKTGDHIIITIPGKDPVKGIFLMDIPEHKVPGYTLVNRCLVFTRELFESEFYSESIQQFIVRKALIKRDSI